MSDWKRRVRVACRLIRSDSISLACACDGFHRLGVLCWPSRSGGKCTHACLQICMTPHPSRPRSEQHVKVSITPMAKVMTILEQACSKLKPAMDPADCQLIVHEGPRSKRTQDLTVPFRLANIAANAKIEVVRGEAGPGEAYRTCEEPMARASVPALHVAE